jgi:hypothetical protein
MKWKVDLDLLEEQIKLCDNMSCKLGEGEEADMFEGLATFLSVILDEIKHDNPIEFDVTSGTKRICDICGKTCFDSSIDTQLKEKYGIEINICIDCNMWFDDNDRYDILLENGIINDEMFNELITGK